MKIAIVGGCFTNQHNIPFDNLYHQTLKRAMAANGNDAEIRTIRYERISKSLEKIENLRNEYDFDLLVFHLRTEQMARISKLYYKHLDNEGTVRHAINLPYLKAFYPEKFDILSQRHFNIQNPSTKESKNHHLMREMNYRLGSLMGNKHFALKLLEKAILEIHGFCVQNNISLLLLGPVAAPFSSFVEKLSTQISRKFETLAEKHSMNYLELLRKVTSDNKPMFFENGIHVSQAGHDEIAGMIEARLVELT